MKPPFDWCFVMPYLFYAAVSLCFLIGSVVVLWRSYDAWRTGEDEDE